MDRRFWIRLAFFLLLTVGGGIAIGVVVRPDAWYAGLAKPSFNPPPWVFAPVWTLLYILIALAGARVWTAGAAASAAWLWVLQLVLNFLWSPLFFGLHAIGAALLVIIALLATILAFIATAWRGDRVAAGLFLPYAAWVGFASVLNAAIYRLNEGVYS